MSRVRKVTLTLVTALFCTLAVAGALAWHNGYRSYIVHTGSMAPALLAGDLILISPAKATYNPGEIITFRHSSRSPDLVTHRVTDIRSGKIHTKGDANRTADVWDIPLDRVQGVFAMRVPRLGYLLYFLRQPAGIASVMSGALTLMLTWELLNPKEEKVADAAAVLSKK
jgi:signal peptidase